MTNLVIVDAHQHFWDLEREAMPWMTDEDTAIRRTFGLADLAPLLVETGVAQTVLVQAAGSDPDTDSMFEHAALHDWIGGVIDHLAKPPLRTGAMTEWADDLRAPAAHGNLAAKISGLDTGPSRS